VTRAGTFAVGDRVRVTHQSAWHGRVGVVERVGWVAVEPARPTGLARYFVRFGPSEPTPWFRASEITADAPEEG
jgi:hypothetical protein